MAQVRLTFAEAQALAGNRGATVIYELNSRDEVVNVLWVNPFDSVVYKLTDQPTETAFLAVFTTAITSVVDITE